MKHYIKCTAGALFEVESENVEEAIQHAELDFSTYLDVYTETQVLSKEQYNAEIDKQTYIETKHNVDEFDLTKLPIGTKVFDPQFGEGEVVRIDDKHRKYPIRINFKGYTITYAKCGRQVISDLYPILYPSKDAWLKNPANGWKDYQMPIPDKALVECWDDTHVAMRTLKFYDAKNGGVFSYDGSRNGRAYAHYKLYEGPMPEWAIEAQKKLED